MYVNLQLVRFWIERPLASLRTRFALSILNAGLVLGLAGCSPDKRISIEEFVELQSQTPPRLAAVEVSEQGAGAAPMAVAPGNEPMTETTMPATAPAFPLARVPYRLGPGDVLAVGLTGLNEVADLTTLQLRVDRKGNINLPIAGEVMIGDMELEDAEDAVLAAYVPRYFKSLGVNLEVIHFDPTTVVVVGAAAQTAQAPPTTGIAMPAGLVSLRRTERTLLHAVAAAGGLNPSASGRVKLQRIRQPGQVTMLNLLDPVELKAALALEPLESGDIVTIEAAIPNAIYVGGLVNTAGPVPLPPGATINLLQCLTAAGGLRPDVFPKEGTLIRRMADGRDVHVKIDLDRLRMDPNYPNVQLAAGDVFVVPDTFGTLTMDFINKSVFFRFGATATYNVIGNATGIEYLNRAEQQSNQTNNGGGTLQNLVDPIGFLAPVRLGG